MSKLRMRMGPGAALLALSVLVLASCNKQPASDGSAEANAPAASGPETPPPSTVIPSEVTGPPRASAEGEEDGDAPMLPDTIEGAPAMMSEDAFLSLWREIDGTVVLDDGLMYRIISSGSGRSPKASDKVRVSYRGTLMDGSVFDETRPGETKMLDLSREIAGWRKIMPLMKEGDKWEVVIPSALAYGEEGNGTIGPNMPLVYEVQLVEVVAS